MFALVGSGRSLKLFGVRVMGVLRGLKRVLGFFLVIVEVEVLLLFDGLWFANRLCCEFVRDGCGWLFVYR